MINFVNETNPITDGFLWAKDALTNPISSVNAISNIEVQNCQARMLFVDKDISTTPTDVPPPAEWADNYVMRGDFSHSTQAGNIGRLLENLTEVLIRRRMHGDDNWVTLKRIIIPNDPDEAREVLKNIELKDYLTATGGIYDYCLVPVIKDGNIIVQGSEPTNPEDIATVEANFDGVFVCDAKSFKKLFGNITYDDNNKKKSTNYHETLNGKFPVVVSNARTNYYQGGITGLVVNDDYCDDYVFDRNKLTKARQEFEEFVSDNKPKVVKDWNGNFWLCMVTDSASSSFDSSWGMGLATVHFSFVEIGDANNYDDLVNAGLVQGV